MDQAIYGCAWYVGWDFGFDRVPESENQRLATKTWPVQPLSRPALCGAYS